MRLGFKKTNLYQARLISDYLQRAQKAKTIQDFQELIKEMHRRRYNMHRIQYALLGFGCLFAYLSYEKIVDWLSDQTTTITNKSLDDPEFFEKIVNFGTEASKRVVYNLSQDEETKDVFKKFFCELFTSEAIISATSTLSDETVKSLLFDKKHTLLRNHIVEFAQNKIEKVMADEKFQNSASTLAWKSANKAFNPVVWILYSNASNTKEEDNVINKH